MSGAANNFSIAPNSFARAIVHHEGKEFIVEFKFDVATVREKAGTAPPQFDLEYRMFRDIRAGDREDWQRCAPRNA